MHEKLKKACIRLKHKWQKVILLFQMQYEKCGYQIELHLSRITGFRNPGTEVVFDSTTKTRELALVIGWMYRGFGGRS